MNDLPKPEIMLDTVSRSIGYGVQIQTTRTPYRDLHLLKFFPADMLQLCIFTHAEEGDDGGSSMPALSAKIYLKKEQVDQLIEKLVTHRLRMVGKEMLDVK